MSILFIMKKYTEKDFKSRCDELDLEFIGTWKEKHKGTMIDFVCNKHKDKGVQSKDWSHLRTEKRGCSYCGGRGLTTKDIMKKINNPNITILSEYKDSETRLKCKCEVCEKEWDVLPRSLITNKSGCPVCGKKQSISSRTKTREEFISELNAINPNIEVLGEYKTTHTLIKCKCKRDGHIWDAYPANLLNRSAGCPMCNISNGERILLGTLKDLGFSPKSQYTIDGCENVKKLRFDAFCEKENLAFEYNGEQHYYPVDFANKGEEWASDEFNKTKERDFIKRKFCRDNNIPLIVIPYWEKHNMKNYILSQIEGNDFNILT